MTQRRVTAYLDHASVSPTFSEAQTTCKSELEAPSRMRGDVDVPLTTEILKESRHQIQRRGLFHSYVLKVSHCAPCIPSVSLCPSCVKVRACHPGRKTRSAILYFLQEAEQCRRRSFLCENTVRLSAGGWNLPLPLLSLSFPLPLPPPLWIGC